MSGKDGETLKEKHEPATGAVGRAAEEIVPCAVPLDRGPGLGREVGRNRMARSARSRSQWKPLMRSAGDGEAIQAWDRRLQSWARGSIRGKERGQPELRSSGPLPPGCGRVGCGRLGTATAVASCPPSSSSSLPPAPHPLLSLPRPGEEQPGDKHPQCHGGLCRDGHSAHGFWRH